MDIEEVKKRKTSLAIDILHAMIKFEEDTGTYVKRIDFDRAGVMGPDNKKLVMLNLEVEL